MQTVHDEQVPQQLVLTQRRKDTRLGSSVVAHPAERLAIDLDEELDRLEGELGRTAGDLLNLAKQVIKAREP